MGQKVNKKTSENPHEKHRERMKNEFLAHGFDDKTSPHRVLELLLFYCVPRVDTNPLAHELINKYKNLSGVLDAPVEELIQFKGITRNNVGLLKMVMPIARIYLKETELDVDRHFTDYSNMCRYIVGRFSGLVQEHFAVIYLDNTGKMLEFQFLSHGGSNTVTVSNRDIISGVIKYNATAVVVAHNHHNSLLLPSAQDVAATQRIAMALDDIDVRLIDHIIINKSDYISMAQSSEYKYIFNQEDKNYGY